MNFNKRNRGSKEGRKKEREIKELKHKLYQIGNTFIINTNHIIIVVVVVVVVVVVYCPVASAGGSYLPHDIIML